MLVALKAGSEASKLAPGMAGSIKLVPYVSKNAIAVPSGAVFEEDDKQFVRVMVDGKEEKREVTVGRATDERTEITSGLSGGEEVVLEARERTGSGPAAPVGGEK